MKRFQNLVVYLVVLILSGAVTVKSVEPGKVQNKAVVRSVKGNATCTFNGVPHKLKVNELLSVGASITTGPDSEVYLSVNGLASAVRVQADTTLVLNQMDQIGPVREHDTDTQLDLKGGSILGQVKKVTGNSSYEIKTPHGVAGIRGTDFNITVTAMPGGTYSVTFTSVSGTVFVSAVVDAQGTVQTVTLHDGESWTPGSGQPAPAVVNLIIAYESQIQALITQVQQNLANGGPTGSAEVNINNNNNKPGPNGGGTQSAQILPPYQNTGGPPNGNQPSGS